MHLIRQPGGTGFTFISDSSLVPGRMGLGAVMVDADGVVAELKCGVMTDRQNAWAAEWLSKMMPVHVARDILHLAATKVLCIADGSSAVISNRRANPSTMPVLDKFRLELARWAATSLAQVGEVYIQAQHNSMNSSPAAKWQARAHDLSTEARDEACARFLPMKSVLGDMWVLLKGDLVCLSPSDTLDGIYEGHHFLGKHLDSLFQPHPGAGSLWTRMVESDAFSNQELNTLLWVRAAPWMHAAASTNVLCRFCRQPVPGWGAHLPRGCIKLAQALLYAFRAVASHLSSLGFGIYWRSVICFVATPRTDQPVIVYLAHNEEYSACQLAHQAVAITWSGLWVDRNGARLDALRHDLLHHYARALIQAARGEVRPLFEDVSDQDTLSADFAAPGAWPLEFSPWCRQRATRSGTPPPTSGVPPLACGAQPGGAQRLCSTVVSGASGRRLRLKGSVIGPSPARPSGSSLRAATSSTPERASSFAARLRCCPSPSCVPSL